MKKIMLSLALSFSAALCFGQTGYISLEDLRYLLHNNLAHADTFLMAKGYTLKLRNEKKQNSEYHLIVKGGTFVNLQLRADGKRLFIDLETTDITQYDLINNSISQYLNKTGSIGDVKTYVVKDLCTVYITMTDTVPYDPLKKDFDMQIVADKNVTAYN